ncbi:lysine exporter LysO family protein [Shewanella sp. SNU WT4]|uniref:lysine exporter LysO family protein n=1 Tax=Shewanella sp. SNU WT4 TaxID=2590015 RepID=UPI001129303D|nr:lysine exporter LysO family protein [Shewanella sp. SNU WT4]QDF68070.1 lysine exporter LysO family protein [Shewanella sp. SNU WT4]
MLSGLLFVLVPLLLGYLVVLKRAKWLELINSVCGYLVIVILFLMGMSLAKLDQLGQNLTQIVTIAGTLFVCISVGNLLVLPLLDRLWHPKVDAHKVPLPFKSMLKDSGKLIGSVIVGLLVGLVVVSVVANGLFWVERGSELILLFLLLLIGIGLRNSGMSLKQILVNPKAMILAGAVILSSLPGGLIAAWILGFSWNQGLALASGFGWYSLTGILVSDHLGPVIGTGAFLNELMRELVALLLIPALIQRYPYTTVGYAGATAMDFTLPVIQQAGGNQFVPIAIVSGFILSLAVPILVVFFMTL